MDTPPTYRTADRYVMAWLAYRGHRYTKAELANGRKVVFTYENTEELQKDVEGYSREECFDAVSPYVLFRRLDAAMDTIFMTKDQHG